MHITLWPLIPRDPLIWAFRPGEPASSEAPFRTLREHDWATAGVRIIPRVRGRTSGRITVFSTLNLEAARLARLHEGPDAARVAKVARAAEISRSFVQLGKLLESLPAGGIASMTQGLVPIDAPERLWEVVLKLAEETDRRWQAASARVSLPEVILGRIVNLGTTALVLRPATGADITLPRWLARAAQRDVVGACLGLVVDQFENRSAFTYALPALDLEAEAPRFSPFGQHGPPLDLTPADLDLFRGEAPALRVPVPVTIGA